jgi:hypothetical protein
MLNSLMSIKLLKRGREEERGGERRRDRTPSTERRAPNGGRGAKVTFILSYSGIIRNNIFILIGLCYAYN